jgi:glycosyltransferase involved in cell wall biosynthesis
MNLGFKDVNKEYPYVITTYDSETNKQEALRLCIESDVIIIGSAPDIYTTKRMEFNKLTFRYSERYFKTGKLRLVRHPRALKSYYMRDTRYRKNPNMRILCASAYTAPDCKFLFAYPKKMYKWGYFPEVIEYDINRLMAEKNRKEISLLWCGRFISWKHPEKAIYVAKRLMQDGYDFKLNLIGTGELEGRIKDLIEKENLRDHVIFLGSMTPENVRKKMEQANIFLFTSDRQEGWGAVLNEAMNSGCAVVANRFIGAAPFLIKNGENGLIYKNNSDRDLYRNVKALVDDASFIDKLGRNAYATLLKSWNAAIASERFINLVQGLLSNEELFYEDGPCSIAKTRI